MKMIFRYMHCYRWAVYLTVFIKLVGNVCELIIPYILEHIIDDVVPAGELRPVFLWGCVMFAAALACWVMNVTANRMAVKNAAMVSLNIRQDFFKKVMNLSGAQFDGIGLPSLTSRMTSDSYNVQNFVRALQALCIRAPIMLLGGLAMIMAMDMYLAQVLLYPLPFMLALVLFITSRGVPLYRRVQEKLDAVVRILRENITGIRVVKALSKTEFEERRFSGANRDMTGTDIIAGSVMSVPDPFMRLCINSLLCFVVFLGAKRVDAGLMKPGVILAFLTYFNMIAMGMLGLNRIFLSYSKAGASADRIAEVLDMDTEEHPLRLEEVPAPADDGFIRFENVSFRYNTTEDSGGEQSAPVLDNISFVLQRGESLGIIGPTGCGKTTIINLLMHFYDAESGNIFVDGRDVRTYSKDELHSKFGTVFQNDLVFRDTLQENIRFGREIGDSNIKRAMEDSMAAEYISSLESGPKFMAEAKGANLSGGQRQRLLVARALAGHPEILVLDDSSSALDYKTDAAMRKAIAEHYAGTTLILIAQRISSVMNMDHILVMDNGKCIGYGTHEELLKSCREYREIFDTQMGAL